MDSENLEVTLAAGYPTTLGTDTKGNTLVKGIILYDTDGDSVIDANGNSVEVTKEFLEVVLRYFEKDTTGMFKRFPPIQVDHDTSADRTLGRIVPPLVRTTITVDGHEREALEATLSVRKKQDEIKQGIYRGLSTRVNLRTGRIREVSIVADPALEYSAVLSSPKYYSPEATLRNNIANMSDVLHNRIINRKRIMSGVRNNCISRYEADKLYEAIKDVDNNQVKEIVLAMPKTFNKFQDKARPRNADAMLLQQELEELKMSKQNDNTNLADAYKAYKEGKGAKVASPAEAELMAKMQELEAKLSKFEDGKSDEASLGADQENIDQDGNDAPTGGDDIQSKLEKTLSVLSEVNENLKKATLTPEKVQELMAQADAPKSEKEQLKDMLTEFVSKL